jgi:hypothetical protein
MPILRRRTTSDPAAQPAGTGAVPGQRDTQEGTTSAQTAAEYSRGEASGATGTGAPAAQAEPRQAVATETRTEARPDARREDYSIGAILTIISGLVTFFMGITGIISAGFYNNVANFPFDYSVRSRGITLLVIGAIAFLVGAALLARMYWARTGAIVVAVFSAIANFMFLPYYPFWSVVVVALNVVIIWELARNRDSRQYARLHAVGAWRPRRPREGFPHSLSPMVGDVTSTLMIMAGKCVIPGHMAPESHT